MSRRPVLLTLWIVIVGVHGISRIHGGKKQKDIYDHTIKPFFFSFDVSISRVLYV